MSKCAFRGCDCNRVDGMTMCLDHATKVGIYAALQAATARLAEMEGLNRVDLAIRELEACAKIDESLKEIVASLKKSRRVKK